MARLISTGFLIFCFYVCIGQTGEIFLNNPSFEDRPHQGGGEYDIGIRGWYDCGTIQFPGETPPDVHPIDFWQVTQTPIDGNTYLGLVIRDNDSWESVSQRLPEGLKAGTCYEISAQLARSIKYLSGSKEIRSKFKRDILVNYTEPAVLRIWGGTGVCGRQELLAESRPVSSEKWEKHTFRLEPNREYNYISFEAFYEVPVLFPYNGHILLDNLSSILEIPCDDNVAIEEPLQEIKVTRPPQEELKAKTHKEPETITSTSPIASNTTSPKVTPPEKISGLGYEKITKGQIIRIENLYFEMDKSKVAEGSFKELDRIFKFLVENDGVVVEIGGHTNTIPPEDYCLKLSTARARKVANYLIEQGIAEHRIKYKGYGKSKPIVVQEGNDMEARQKNQRVEIKILEVG